MSYEKKLELSQLQCPKCKARELSVIDSRTTEEGGFQSVRRRRLCQSCGHRYTTYEVDVHHLPRLNGAERIFKEFPPDEPIVALTIFRDTPIVATAKSVYMMVGDKMTQVEFTKQDSGES